jgi:hypothetical protein
MTNGKETELDYFNALRDEPWITARVQVKFRNGDPSAVVLRAAAFRDREEYDEAWAVCDVDMFDVTQAIANADSHDVGLTLSAPCFEVWLILHLSKSCPGFNNASQADAHLRKMLPSWDKSNLRFNDFGPGVFHAAARAKRLADPPDANPSTAVWRLIDSLRHS